MIILTCDLFVMGLFSSKAKAKDYWLRHRDGYLGLRIVARSHEIDSAYRLRVFEVDEDGEYTDSI